jgi:hypothetical protein
MIFLEYYCTKGKLTKIRTGKDMDFLEGDCYNNHINTPVVSMNLARIVVSNRSSYDNRSSTNVLFNVFMIHG